jgi:hypothetical protein
VDEDELYIWIIQIIADKFERFHSQAVEIMLAVGFRLPFLATQASL